jgi:hypothetical protein
MPNSNTESVKKYQELTFRLNPKDRLKTPVQALQFVNERGFIFLWPVKGINLPSLWAAVAGDRPVPNEHDDPAHITWGWKDQALGKRIWYYAKGLRRKATFISLDVLPFFYALSDNYGSPDEDYLIAYQDGNLTQAEKLIYEALLQNGPMHTIDLRKYVHMAEKSSDYLFNRGLERLQSGFRILPVGVAEAGTWKYAFIYDLTHRHYPDLVDKARIINESEAYRKLVELLFLSVGFASEHDVQKLFQWKSGTTRRVLEDLVQAGILFSEKNISGKGQIDYYLQTLRE